MENGPAVFVSDVHLYFGGEAYLSNFVAFLGAVPGLASRLFIHGDLFDFYVGGKQGSLEFYRPLFDGIGALTRQGVAVTLLAGNRDYLLDRTFVDQGARLAPDEIDLELGRFSVHLSHGDEFCVHDHSYQMAKKILRSPPMRWIVQALPAGAGIFAARRYRAISARKTARLKETETNRLGSILDGVTGLLSRRQYDIVICGHIHHLAETPVSGTRGSARLFTTGAWEDGPNYLHFDGGDLRIRRFDPGKPQS